MPSALNMPGGIAEHYSRRGVNAVALWTARPAMERKRMVEEFKTWKNRGAVNVDVFSEGFDCPDVEFVELVRPTLSLAKYLQQVGRGLRRSEGKEACMLIDNVGVVRISELLHSDGTGMLCWGRMAGKGSLPGRMNCDSLFPFPCGGTG